MSLVRNVNQVFVTRATLYLLAFLLNVIIARGLGPDGRGLYSLFFLMVSITATVMGLGSHIGTIYFLGRGDMERRVLLGNGNLIALAALGIATVGMALFALFFGADAFVSGRAYWLYAPAIALTVYFSQMSSFLQGDARFTAMNGVWLMRHGLTLCTAAALMATDRLSIFNLLLTWTLSLAAADLIALALVGIKNLDMAAILRPRWQALRTHISFGVRGQASDLIQFLNLRLDALLVAAFIDTDNVGYYAVAVGLTETIWWLAYSVSTVLLPRLIRAGGEQAAELTTLACRNTMMISAAAAIALALLASLVVKSIFGDEFSPAVDAVYWLLPGTVAISGQSVLTSYFVSRGKVILSSYSAAIALGATVILDLLLIPPFGISGAAIASSAAYATSLGVSLLWYQRLFGNNLKDVLLPRSSDLALYWDLARRLGGRYVPLRRS